MGKLLKKLGCGTWLSVLLAWLMCPLPSLADDLKPQYCIDNPDCYSVELRGNNTIVIKMPVYNKVDTDSWAVEPSELYIEYDGGRWNRILGYGTVEKNIAANKANVLCNFKADIGTMTLQLNSGGVKLDNDFYKQFYIPFNGTEEAYAELEWIVPVRFRGKKLTFRWDVQRDGNNSYTWRYVDNIPNKTIEIPEKMDIMTPTLTQAIISDEAQYAGKVLVPWMIAVDESQVTEVSYTYKDKYGNTITAPLEKAASGYVVLDAASTHKNLVVQVKYKDVNDSGEILTVKSDPYDVPLLHAPVNMKAEMLDDHSGTVRVTWDIDNVGVEDLIDPDSWEIQRSLSGKEDDYVTINTEVFSNTEGTYSIDDDTFIESLESSQLGDDGTITPRYRVRRSVSAVWGWLNNPLTATTSFSNKLNLLTIKDASGIETNSEMHTLQATWNYLEPESATERYVWDERATMKIIVRMYKEDGELVDSLIHELTQDDIKAQVKSFNLPRSCVNYEISMTVDYGNSPLVCKDTWIIIDNPSKWEELAALVKKGKRVNVLLTTDLYLNTNTYIGNAAYPYKGIFEGNGHKIVMENNKELLENAENASFRNLTVEMPSKNSGSEMTGFIYRAYNVTFYRCRSNSRFNLSISDVNNAGFVNYGDNVKFYDCLFAGEFKNLNQTVRESSGFISKFVKTAIFNNCVYAPLNARQFNEIHPFAPYDNNPERIQEFKNCYVWAHEGDEYDNCYKVFTADSESSADEGLKVLGSKWEKTSTFPFVTPKSNILSDERRREVMVETDNLYFESSGKVKSNSLVTETRQSSVMLTWETEGGVIDFFEVMRRPKGADDSKWETVKSGIMDLGYEDTTVSPIVDYEYKVRSAIDCEGMHYNETEIVEGACKHTGKLEGYVRYPDGTGLAGITVIVSANGQEIYLTTDDKGHYEVDELGYYNQNTITYRVRPSGVDLGQANTSHTAEFNGKTNYAELTDFIVVSGYKFAGKVVYSGTNIPVPGVHFQVNGHEVHNSTGKALETDTEGRFQFYVNEGNNKIQAQLDGHDFKEGGWYKGKSGQENGVNFHGDVSLAYFYDDTTVKLIGRVAGGSRQGGLPLANSLSHNNLGDTIVVVLALEGDNKSRLVYDITDPLKEETDTVYYHQRHDKAFDYRTVVHTNRRTVRIWPDPHTGEYEVMLPPVKWKVQQIYCTGHATLFQEGKASDVIDLTNTLTPIKKTYKGPFTTYGGSDVESVEVEYNAIYNRIWHAPVELTYQQLGFNNFGYFGDLNYSFANVDGTKATVPLAYEVSIEVSTEGSETKAKKVEYTFGHPVFSIERQYPFKLAAVERYFWNNNSQSDTIDVVKLKGGTVSIQNGMISSTHKQDVDLDDNGEAIVPITASQTTYLLTKEEALKTVSMTLTLDGTTYEAAPLNAYVLNIYARPGAKDIVSVDRPVLVDILRDPPGGGSKATLSKGSELKYSYSMDMEWKLGTGINLKQGSSIANFSGMVAAPMGAGGVAGFNYGAETDWETKIDIIANGKGKRAFSYTMKAGNDISTSSSSKLVGAPADVFIGVQQSVTLTPALTIRAIPDAAFQQMQGAVKAGQALEIASGKGGDGKLYHLVRDESLAVGPKFKSTFMHTQQHIITNTLPDIMNRTKAMMFTGTEAEAQKKANATQKPVYHSLVSEEDENFAVANTYQGEYYCYTSKSPVHDGMNYRIILPDGYDETELTDEVYDLNQTFFTWVAMLIQNEKEKLSANELVKNFDVDGGVGMSYEEEFESSYDYAYSLHIPIFTDIYDSFFMSGAAGAGIAIAPALAAEFGGTLFKYLSSIGKLTKTVGGIGSGIAKTGNNHVEVGFIGTKLEIEFEPALEFETVPEFEKDRSWSRKESFDIEMDKKSHLNFDVYRVKTVNATDVADTEMDVFTSEKFYGNVNYDNDYISRYFKTRDFKYAKSFVYRTRGGATCRPYEGERVTSFYRNGEVLDVATKKIENPKIRMDKQSVSGVPYGEPARFKLYLANESESPENVYPALNLYLDDTSNPNGAVLKVDGYPVTWDGFSISIEPGHVTEKTLEVYAGNGFDYEGIRLGLKSEEDTSCFDEVTFDVHFLRSAGPVNISNPGDKWVMNTDAPHDKTGYHMPVTIDGFDKNQPNFDHIEFQYKESARGDDYWVNICSFFADDSLYNLASGVKEMIPMNGNIETQFYGEGEFFEKAYDLRAVLFCRNGSDYITSSSKVLSGIKDTRRPQLFGTPEPVDGILNIGENIVFSFSEAIEHNYLDNMVNFDVKGEVNNKDLTHQICLQFSGNGGAQTEARRNFSGKDVTVEMTIKPDNTGKEMPLFSHGNAASGLQLLLTQEKYLKVVIPTSTENNNIFTSSKPVNTTDFCHVAMVLRTDTTSTTRQKLLLYIGSERVGEFETYYNGTGELLFGSTNESVARKRTYYSGRMMEARVWYRALDATLMDIYGNKRLTGYELGLADYYPMNEGIGNYATDRAQGASLKLGSGITWSQPGGMSLHIDLADEGIPLNKNFLDREKEYDYTLMFWFKTDQKGRGVLISNGSGEADELGAENRFCISFDSDKLMYKTQGREYNVPGYYSDNKWHHFAITVNRPHNVANIYVDQTLRSTISADSIGGMTGGYPMLGAALKEKKVDGNVVLEDTRNWLTGEIDEIGLFAQALPMELLKYYSTHNPKGDEAGLIFFMSFSHQELQADGSLEEKPYAYSSKKYINHDGSVVYEKDEETQEDTTTPKHDYIFDRDNFPEDKLISHITQSTSAPCSQFETLDNLKFSHVGRDNQLLININEVDEKINKRNIYVTLRDIPDMNGNEMVSPVTACFFVDRNPLRWQQKKVEDVIWENEGTTIEVEISNEGSVQHTYTVTNIPKWLKVSPSTNVIEAQNSATLKLTVDKSLDVGFYDNIIYLTDENGLADPLAINITVITDQPEWYVNSDMKEYNMGLVGTVLIKDEIDTDSRDLVGVFDQAGNCHGRANIEYNEDTGENGLYLTIYNNSSEEIPLSFRLWRYSTGKVMDLQTEGLQTITFKAHEVLGRDKPVVLIAGNSYNQTIELAKGWNWMSTNIYNDQWKSHFRELLEVYNWTNGDVITDNTDGATMTYSGDHWNVSDENYKFHIVPQHMYCIYVKEPLTVYLSGTIVEDKYQRTIPIKNGWNSIGYTPMVNLPVATALTDYRDHAMNGDVIKSHDQFAVLTITSNNSYIWNGSLKYMKPGEGYMLLHQAPTECEFIYPFYEPGSVFFESAYNAPKRNDIERKATTMSVAAVTNGIELQEGDLLQAYAEGELCGEAQAQAEDGIFYLSIQGNERKPMWFAIMRDGELVASTRETIRYQANQVIGSPSEPTSIDFTHQEFEQEGWYSVQGFKLPGKPSQKGVYIYNGKKVHIK